MPERKITDSTYYRDLRERKITDSTYYRDLVLDRKAIDEEARIVPASLSSETEVPRWFGREVLVHEDGAVDLGRAADGLPLLFGHNADQPIGLAENVRLEGGRLRADLRFSSNARATEVWGDVRDGFLRNVSIGYRVRKWEENEDDDIVRVTDWELLEASVVTVPADAAVGVNRGQVINEGVRKMSQDDKGTKPDGQGTNVVDYSTARATALAEGREEGVRRERQRQDEINLLFTPARFQTAEFQGLRESLIRNGDSVEVARARLLELVGAGAEPVAGDRREDQPAYRGQVSGGATDAEKFAEGMQRALEARVNIEKDPERLREIRASEFAGMNVGDMARDFCRRHNIRISGLTRDQIIGEAMRAVTHSSSDFANVLQNVASKSLLSGWMEAPETWQAWTRTGSLPDFKQATRTGVSAFSDLDLIYENGEYKHGTASDLKETIQLLTYGKLFGISRQALANDDLSALSSIPMKMGRAAARKVGDKVYALLSGVGPTLNQDSTALFDASGHSNYVASGSGAAPSVTTLNAGEVAMGTQTDPAGVAYLNIDPRYLLVPKALANTARVLVASQYDPAGTAGTLTPNPFSGRLTVVAEARLDADLSTGWYLAADPNMWDTIEVAFLDGRQEPYLEQQDGWTRDGVEYKVRIDCAVAALDFRGLYKNYGA